MDNLGSAHPLVEVNVSFKLEGNPSIGIGFIERTWHNVLYLFVYYLTFNCKKIFPLVQDLQSGQDIMSSN